MDVDSRYYVSVNDQSANVDENSAAGTTVLNTVVTVLQLDATSGMER